MPRHTLDHEIVVEPDHEQPLPIAPRVRERALATERLELLARAGHGQIEVRATAAAL